ncbi:MAG: polysaccharide deacetylase family protein [Elusimicrobiales bacterium]
MPSCKISLKLDIDTRRGMEEGLPRLLGLFARRKLRASVFFSYGPDESGKAVKRIFTKKGFLKKMFRTNAAKLYGFRTMLYGTLLPAPLTAAALPELVKRTRGEGHETGVHAWSHVRWQDELDNLSREEISRELELAVRAHREITGAEPEGFAAPAWQISAAALEALSGYGWKYISTARGSAPARFAVNGAPAAFPEIPTTMPTLDEILAWNDMTEQSALEHLSGCAKPDALNVYTLHAEAEGLAYLGFFEKLLERWSAAGCEFATLAETARGINPGGIAASPPKRGELPGRAGTVAVC